MTNKVEINGQLCYKRHSVLSIEEDEEFEFKGHRSFVEEELPYAVKINVDKRSRQSISKHACGMLNTGKGGVILMGVLDDGRVEGFAMTKFQQDHVELSIQEAFDRYVPQVAIHRYKVQFVPVLDDVDSSKDLEATTAAIDIVGRLQDPTIEHMLRTNEHCWCDNSALACTAWGRINPFFVVELHLLPFDPNDCRNKVQLKVWFCYQLAQ